MKKDCPKRFQAGSSNQKGEAGLAQALETEPMMLTASQEGSREGWMLDSGCSYHITKRRDLMFDVEEVNGGRILMGNDSYCEITAIGKIKIVNSDGSEVILSKVRYSPTARRNLISSGQLETLGCWYQSKNFRLRVFKGDKEVIAGDYKDTLYILDGEAELAQVNVAASSPEITGLWHSRLGHISEKNLKIMVQKKLLKEGDLSEMKNCEYCILGKSHKTPYKTGKHTSKEILEYVHSDLWGSPNVTLSLSKCQYYISFVDDFSRKVWIYFLKTKDEAYTKFVEWLALVENQSGKRLKVLRTDNGLEYCNKSFDDYCKERGIVRHKTCPYTPQQNGVAERLNRTILEKVRSLLSETGLGESFWAEASSTVVYIINRTPSAPLGFEIPEQIYTGREPDYSHMKRFGCLVYYHVEQGKLKPRAKKGVFMGYPQGVKGYRIWSIEDKKCVVSRDVKFREDVLYKDIGKMSEAEKDVSKLNGRNITIVVPGNTVDGATLESQGETSSQDHTQPAEAGDGVIEVPETAEEEAVSDDESTHELDNYLLARDRDRRTNIRPPSRYDHGDVAMYALTMSHVIDLEEPQNYQEAMNCRENEKWKLAAHDEMISLDKNHTWILVERPKHRKVIGCKWIFKIKDGIPGIESPRFKARLVAKGFSQIKGIDYQQEYLEKVLRNFNMLDSRPVLTPMGSHFKLSSIKPDDKAECEAEMKDTPYASAVGSLMYSMVGTRPDIAYAVGLVSRFMSCPSREHWSTVKWVLRYIRSSADLKLTFTKSKEFKVRGYCDSDYSADLDRRRSITGYVFQVGENTISWRSGL